MSFTLWNLTNIKYYFIFLIRTWNVNLSMLKKFISDIVYVWVSWCPSSFLVLEYRWFILPFLTCFTTLHSVWYWSCFPIIFSCFTQLSRTGFWDIIICLLQPLMFWPVCWSSTFASFFPMVKTICWWFWFSSFSLGSICTGLDWS